MKARPLQAMPRRPDSQQARAELTELLCESRGQIEEALLVRTYAIADPKEVSDPEYAQGLRGAVSAALDYGLEGIERGEKRAPPIPVVLLAQARLATRNGVSLDTILRRYMAGQAVLAEFVIEAAEEAGLQRGCLRGLLSDQAAIFDRLVEAVSEEYRRESLGIPRSAPQRRAERVRRLLAGEPIDASQLSYEVEAFHVGVVGRGPAAGELVRLLASQLDMRLLWVPADEDRIWAWLGSRRPIAEEKMVALAHHASAAALDAVLACGEPAGGHDGWRLSHRQALVALPLAGNSPGRAVRYSEVGLLASVMSDDLLVESLQRLYVRPLAESSDGGGSLRETLRAYLAAGRNITSAAAALRVSRQTVRRRLRTVDELIGRSLDECVAEVEIALRLAEREPGRIGNISPS
jgi:hypothetical protein